jgi:hypothetical protein
VSGHGDDRRLHRRARTWHALIFDEAFAEYPAKRVADLCPRHIGQDDAALRMTNGDSLDFASISRWPLVEWCEQPDVKEEIQAATASKNLIEKACGPDVPKFWPLGNHDTRLSTYIAAHADRLRGLKGIRLQDCFPNWRICWSVEVNGGIGNTVLVKHNFKGGVHAPRNNVVNAGCHMITSHLHSAKVTPVTFYKKTYYGVDTGCLADVYGPQFEYCQNNPRDWRSAFVVLTFIAGRLMQPELCLKVDDNNVEFRSEIIEV